MASIARALVAALITVTTGVVVPAGPALAGDAGCPHEVGKIAAPAAFQHAVILIHGWTSNPKSMMAIRGAVDKGLPGRTATYSFDYSKTADNWAGDKEIAGCLAEYIDAISQASIKAGGDGKVILVGHSMGGLAARYASAKVIGGRTVGDQIAGLVTINTPHLGSFWSRTGFARVAADLFRGPLRNGYPLPDPKKDGARCLAPHSGGTSFPKDCGEVPPYLPKTAKVLQINGRVSVKRTVLGVPVYTFSLLGDTVVDFPSQVGYPKSGPGGAAPGHTSSHSVDCVIATGQITKATAARYPQMLGLTVATQLFDHAAMNDAMADRASANQLALLAVARFAAPCSHQNITSEPRTLRKVTETIDRWLDPLEADRRQWVDYFHPARVGRTCISRETATVGDFSATSTLTQRITKVSMETDGIHLTLNAHTRTVSKGGLPGDAGGAEETSKDYTYVIANDGRLKAPAQSVPLDDNMKAKVHGFVVYPSVVDLIAGRGSTSNLDITLTAKNDAGRQMIKETVGGGQTALKMRLQMKVDPVARKTITVPLGTFKDVVGLSLTLSDLDFLNAAPSQATTLGGIADALVSSATPTTVWFARGTGQIRTDSGGSVFTGPSQVPAIRCEG